MRAQALICDEKQAFSLREVNLPDPGPEHIVVRTLCSGISVGTEFALIRNKLSWGPYPLATGYQATGIVEQVGDRVEGFRTGDKVYYRDNQQIELPDGARVSAVSGTHCSRALIDPLRTHGVALLPAGVPDDVGSLFVMPAVGLYGVDMANPRMGDTVVVYGAGLIGLGVIAACSHRGAVVVAADLERSRLEIAAKLGADHAIDSSVEDVRQRVYDIAPDGADVVFEATGVPACVDAAMALCRVHGKFVFQGNYGAPPLSFRFLVPHGKRLTAFFPCDDGLAPCRRAVLKNIATGVLPWHLTLTHRAAPDDAPSLYTSLNEGGARGVLGAVIRWST
jgi:2-desacetyl-2-hydroxyethyl bacteriochlorophyllide A dehydrogenase